MTKNSIKVTALSERTKRNGQRARILTVQNAPVKVTDNEGTIEYRAVVFSLLKPDKTDPEDKGCDGIHIFLDSPKQLDRLIKSLKRQRIFAFGPKYNTNSRETLPF